ncbi:hypothetical protein POUND7_013837 [Theobroma cacao]
MANHFCCSWSLPCFLPFLFLLPRVNSIHFKISRFDPEATNIVYEGDAQPYVGAVDFNSVSYLCRVGRVSYAQSVPIWDSGTNKVADFTTHFSFFIDTLNRNISMYAAGLAFFLAPVGFEIPPNSAGGFLGLFNTTTSDSPRNQIVLVEFDTFPNPQWDPPVQHVGINTNSISSAKYTPWNFSLYSGKTADTWISYNATTKNLSVTWNYPNTTIFQLNFSLSHHIDLKQILPEWVKVGISAATSHFQEGHRLVSWEFSSSLEIKKTKGKNIKNIKLIVVLAVLGILMTVVSISFVFYRRWKKVKEEREERTNVSSINDDLERGAGPRRFSYGDLVVATNNFSNQRNGNLLSSVDERLHTEFDGKQIERLMMVGLWCAHPDSNLRPSIRQAIQVLDFDVALPNLPLNMPIPTYHQPEATASSSSNEPFLTNSSLNVGR